MKIYKVAQNPIRIMVFQGSARDDHNCPDQRGKTHYVVQHAIKNVPEGVEIDYCDLAVSNEKSVVQPCKACVSTAGGFHCHWPCSCYAKVDEKDISADSPKDLKLDFMYQEDIYDRLSKCDGFIFYSPVNWFSVPPQIQDDRDIHRN